MQGVIILFRTRIRELRERFGFNSQQSFADAFGVAQSTVGNWEAGKREPNYETTIRLADFFHTSIDYLLGREDIKKEPATSSHGKSNETYTPKISDDEYLIILAYRQASPADRQIIDNIVSRYSPSEHVSPPTARSSDKAV